MTLFYIVGATLGISLLSLLGILFISRTKKFLDKTVFLLVGLSTGTLLGGAFFHLIPESLDSALSMETVLTIILISYVAFFLAEKVLHWRHCHDGECDVHPVGYVNLLGDAIHNFIDGLIIAAAFMVDVRFGFITTMALAFHEIPQEMGDFGVLIYSGISKGKAVMYNFYVALMAVAGGVLGYFFLTVTTSALDYLLPVAAGGFLYIATSDLVPEIRDETNLVKSLKAFSLFIIGIVLMYFLKSI